MTKKCVDCGIKAGFRIKNTSEFYCRDCAEEHFSDLDLLIKIEEEATRLREHLDHETGQNN
ncbi:MAG TPA: hypothetical protein VJI98_05155 [Candidatus Nanoarchaeia archaeon]|nr:hypothetical protein [Candidatus Nanoarchaeia archaeon]